MSGPRDFAAELVAAREAGDWEAHARIWDERLAAAVDADEVALDLVEAAPALLKALEAICADPAIAQAGGPLIQTGREAILKARRAQ